MNWKEIQNLDEKSLLDESMAKELNLAGHPEFPNIADLPPEETLELLSDFLLAEGQTVNLRNLLNYAPLLEIVLVRRNLPSIYG